LYLVDTLFQGGIYILQIEKKKWSYLHKKKSLLSIDYRRWRLTQQLDHWSYRIIGLEFLLPTIGILSGVVWVDEAWGSYWS
jgi:ABC-type transport system involved in cytochrome c biogenesis permease subunit